MLLNGEIIFEEIIMKEEMTEGKKEKNASFVKTVT